MQLFETIPPPSNILYDLLKHICNNTIINDNIEYYVFDMSSYKKAIYYQVLDGFLLTCKSYYKSSKKYYCNRKLSYNSITTIFRQICNSHSIIYKTKTQYYHSDYTIIYLIPVCSCLNQ